MARRPKLRLVGTADPNDVFDDLAALRQEQQAQGSQRRAPLTETFARIPHDKALALYRQVGGTVWVLLFELDRLILKAGGQNPIPLSSKRLRAIGLTEGNRMRALRQLEIAGVILIKRRGRGHSPWVFHTWYPKRS
jgi:hypothetical protein